MKQLKYLNNYEENNLILLKKWLDNQILTINESSKLEKLEDIWTNLINKSEHLSKSNKNKLFSYAITVLLTFYSLDQIKKVNSQQPVNIKNIEILDELKFDEIGIDTTPDIRSYYNNDDNNDNKTNLQDPVNLKASKDIIDFLKKEEGDPRKKGKPVLTAYKLGDGMITVGWGHAEKIKASKFKVGQKIDIDEAEKLFQKDLKTASDAVIRIFKEWKGKGINIKLTQKQFDSLVSLTFNAGIGNVRNSDFIQSIKQNNIIKAGGEILSFKKDNFAGLKTRREKESELFLEG